MKQEIQTGTMKLSSTSDVEKIGQQHAKNYELRPLFTPWRNEMSSQNGLKTLLSELKT